MRYSSVVFSSLLLSYMLCADFVSAASKGDSRVSNVVVFADRAEVTRQMQSACKDGHSTANFSHLPSSLVLRSLRGEASGAAKVIGVSSRVVEIDVEDQEPARQALDKKIEALEREAQQLAYQRNTLEEKVQLTHGYGSYFVHVLREEMSSTRPDLRRWQDALNTLTQEQRASSNRLLEMGQQQRSQQRKLRQLRTQRDRFGSDRPEQGIDAEVMMSCTGTGSVMTRLSYVVPGATWKPEYDLRFYPDAGKVGRGRVELTVAAVIQQASGEDWDKAKIQLSTSKPKLGSEAPELAALYVDGYEAGKERVLVQGVEDRRSLPGGGKGASQPQSASLDDHGQSFLLKLPQVVSVRSDGRPYWFPVDLLKARGKAALVSVPKMSPYVFQLVKLNNPASYPLLAGRMHVYRRGAFVGDLQLPYSAAGEPLEISLGIDEAFKVKRVDIEEKDSKGHLLSRDKDMLRAYRLTLHNRSKQKLPVELRENIPVSKIEDVKVTLDKKRCTKGYKLDATQGFITWTISPKPGRAQYVDLVYKIALPKEWQVN